MSKSWTLASLLSQPQVHWRSGLGRPESESLVHKGWDLKVLLHKTLSSSFRLFCAHWIEFCNEKIAFLTSYHFSLRSWLGLSKHVGKIPPDSREIIMGSELSMREAFSLTSNRIFLTYQIELLLQLSAECSVQGVCQEMIQIRRWRHNFAGNQLLNKLSKQMYFGFSTNFKVEP